MKAKDPSGRNSRHIAQQNIFSPTLSCYKSCPGCPDLGIPIARDDELPYWYSSSSSRWSLLLRESN